jgi:hypothetical protein
MIESTLDVGGAVVFWTASEFTDRDKLRAGFAPLALDRFAPDPRPHASVLKDVLEEALGCPRVLVRPLTDRNGFTVVREERGRTANWYATELTTRVTDADPPFIDFDPLDDRALLVNAAFPPARRPHPHGATVRLPGEGRRIPRRHTRLRPTGAVYWAPGPKLDDWASVVRAVEAAADAGRAPCTGCGTGSTPTRCGPSATRSWPRCRPRRPASGTR